MRWRPLFVYAPLIGHVVPTLVVAFGFVIPGSPIDGLNVYTIGFVSAVVGFVPAYIAGIAIAMRSCPDAVPIAETEAVS